MGPALTAVSTPWPWLGLQAGPVRCVCGHLGPLALAKGKPGESRCGTAEPGLKGGGLLPGVEGWVLLLRTPLAEHNRPLLVQFRFRVVTPGYSLSS